MVRADEMRSAATETVGKYADYDDEYDYHQALVSDEVFGTLAFVAQQLDIQTTHGELEGAVATHIDEAGDAISDALAARAEQVREEVADAE